MHEHKLPEFNPLDLLATAASLQRPGRGVTGDDPAMRRDNGPARRTRSATALAKAVDSAKLKNKKLETDLKIYKVVVKNELSKMLEEHNYGHPKRNFRYGYILDDEPFSSEDKDLDCSEFRDCVKGSPTGLSPERPHDNNCNTLLPEKDEVCVGTQEVNDQTVRDSEPVTEEIGAAVVNRDLYEKPVDALPVLALLDNTSECSSSILTLSDDGDKQEGQLSGLPEVRHVDRIESCDDETALVDVETVSVDSKLAEQVLPVEDKPVDSNHQYDSQSTLDGFIVSDPCHSYESGTENEMCSKIGESMDSMDCVNDSAKSGQGSAVCVQPDPAAQSVAGNIKKQTIIRSLLTGETIVVVQKSQNGSTELGKIPLLVDSSQTPLLHRKLCENSEPAQAENCVLTQKCPENTNSTAVPSSGVHVEQPNSKIDVSNKSNSELSHIEIAQQQNLINSYIVAGKDKLFSGNLSEIGGVVVSPDKKVPSPTVVSVPVAPTNAPVPQPASAHSSLLAKLTAGVTQRKGHAGPVLVPSSSEQFNIGRFASVSSSKVGLVRTKAPPKTHGSVTTAGRKTPPKSRNYDNAAYQEVIKKFPNLAKACRDDDLLKMAVAPDDVLQCQPSVPTRAPKTDHVHHDHDYCLKGSSAVAALLAGSGRVLSDIDREPKLGRPPKNADRRKKYVRKKAEGTASRANSPSSEESAALSVAPEAETMSDLKLDSDLKVVSAKRRSSRPKSGRDSSPGESIDSTDADGDGTKVKITGAFQDDFVYFINKTSRNRRRASEQPQAPVPVVQASDIFIPHLSDADIAALKDKHGAGGATERNSGPTNINDEDSNVINTILSMESSISQVESPSTDSFAYPGSAGDSLHGLDFTQEQMDILFSAIAKYKGETEFSSAGSQGEASPVKTSPDSEPDNSFTDQGSHLLGNEDNIHEHNVNLILSDASNMKTYLPTLDATEVQDSISAIASTSLEPGVGSEGVTIDSSASCPNPGTYAPPIEPSIDKSLDLLSVEDMRTDLFPDMGLQVPEVSSSPVIAASTEAPTNSPLIVTVSMYWNDLPAIMLGNLPYVRLVDIYKQILPAKDTGILKKRCQLLGIEVKNCTEMQRYFLVKYGRGYNSKSTLVVGKDDAMRLIAFYVEPQSRLPNIVKGFVDKAPGSSSLPPKLRKQSVASEASCDSVASRSTCTSPGVDDVSLVDEPATSKKEKPKSVGPRTPSRRRPSLVPDSESVARRLRHKKINFRNMVHGIKRETEVVTGESPVPAAAPTEASGANTQPVVVSRPIECAVGTVAPLPELTDKSAPAGAIIETLSETLPSPITVPTSRPPPPRSSSKTSRQHPYAVVKQRPLRSYSSSLLGKQLRRAKGNFHNGTLQNVLKKRQLNGAVQKSAYLVQPKGKLVVPPVVEAKSVVAAPEMGSDSAVLVAVTTPTVVRRLSRRRGIGSPTSSDRVRSSGRKRKHKQLYPIENYSYAKKQKKTVRVQSLLQTCSLPTPLRTSPRKKRAEMTSRLDNEGNHVGTSSRSTSEDEENRPKNVITLANGPEFETFTALTGEFSV